MRTIAPLYSTVMKVGSLFSLINVKLLLTRYSSKDVPWGAAPNPVAGVREKKKHLKYIKLLDITKHTTFYGTKECNRNIGKEELNQRESTDQAAKQHWNAILLNFIQIN